MHSTVVIKGSKAGMSVILDPEAPFDTLLLDVAKKFSESAKFWGAVQMTLTLEGRALTPEEEFSVVNVITENSNIEILCLLDTDSNRIAKCEKALNERLMELSSQTGQFFRGNLRRGEVLESEASIVIIGDVGHGAKVVAKGNVIVLGTLNGTVHAGVTGNADSVIVAFEMAPMQLRIAGSFMELTEKGKRLGRGPMTASVEDGKIAVKSIRKNFFNAINFI